VTLSPTDGDCIASVCALLRTGWSLCREGLTFRNPEESRRFYDGALAPLGYRVVMELPKEHTGGLVILGYGVPPKPDFWIAEGTPNEPRVHVAFRAESRAVVDAFYRAALAAGGRDNGPPGTRPHYHASYYGAFVLDPDGHNIEAVCHSQP
jgi:catechol 2,3-dioxygenase-like lactoylglutathione lyase family enzyme